MDTIIVLKFGGSSVADDIKLNIVAKKIISLKKEAKKIVVVVSAQGKTTDKLIKEAKELSAIPNEREMDVLVSAGELISSAKLSILLNRLGYNAISLTGWQAGIVTNSIYQSASIDKIYTSRIEKELEKNNIVIVAGFQGINGNNDITTLGRGGSDTTAVALAAALKADKCYIFSDVDGVYSTDTNKVRIAKKLDEISFLEMKEISNAGAKVLHNRCVEIGEKFNCNIVVKSTFSIDKGTRLTSNIESSEIKGIVLNDKLVEFEIYKQNKESITQEDNYKILSMLIENKILVTNIRKNNNNIKFIAEKTNKDKIQEILDKNFKQYIFKQNEIKKVTIVGYGIVKDNYIINNIIEVLKNNNIEIYDINLEQVKIEVLINDITDDVIEKLHRKLIREE